MLSGHVLPGPTGEPGRRGMLLPPAERKTRQAQKLDTALHFLNKVLYSTPEIIGRAVGLKFSSGWYRTLHTLESQELITSGTVDLYGRKIQLWGITTHGQAIASARLGLPPTDRYFVPSKVGITTLMHFLGLQTLQVKAEAAGWTEWTYCDATWRPSDPGAYRPDVFARTAKGAFVAIEYERTIKNPKRYRDILAGHLQALRAGKVQHVIYVADGEGTAQVIRRHMTGIEAVKLGSILQRIDPARDLQGLHFVTFDQFPIVKRS